MKKLLSITMAIAMMLTCLSTGLSVMAEEKKCNTQIRVESQIKGAADYLVTDSSAFAVENAGDLYTLIKAGKDMSSYKDAFLKAVKANLDVNDGRLINTTAEWYQDENGEWLSKETKLETAATYGAVILVFDAYGMDFTAFKGYNIASGYAEIDVNAVNDNPYNYYLAIQGAELAGNSKLVTALCEKFIKNFYVADKGMDYYGFSCDNTAKFVYTLAPYYDVYKDVIDNAVKVIEQYKKDNGYFSSTDYISNVNSDSTALALAAYSALGNADKVKSIYNELCAFELKDKPGQFDYEKNEEANIFAIKDALFALEAMNAIFTPCFDGHTFSPSSPVCEFCDEENPDFILDKVKDIKTTARTTSSATLSWSKVNGADSYIVYKYNSSSQKYDYIAQTETNKYKLTGLKAGQTISVKVAAVRKNNIGAKSDTVKTNATPLQGKINSLATKKKKQITVKFAKKVCSGYQIEWSTSSKFTSNRKSVFVSSKSTSKNITTAKSKKKYYVRVRAYTTINGSKIYGSWSPTKSITVK